MARIGHIYTIRSYALEPRHALKVSLDNNQSFLDSISTLVKQGKLKLSPGRYMYQEDEVGVISEGTRRGVFFTITKDHTFVQGLETVPSSPNYTYWPPREMP